MTHTRERLAFRENVSSRRTRATEAGQMQPKKYAPSKPVVIFFSKPFLLGMKG